METSLYSVRMRASCQGRHLAGAERIVPVASVSEMTTALMSRAMNSCQGQADKVHCCAEQIDLATVCYEQLPDVFTYLVNDWHEGRYVANCLLLKAGIQADIITQAMELIAEGAGPGGTVMRGAVLMDVITGERLEKDTSRGVRVSRMDIAPVDRPKLEREMVSKGLGHHRVLEALVLAGKVISAPGIVAELCWSDDPHYTTGYVADQKGGYQRVSKLKPAGEPHGGRVFFVDRSKTSIDELVGYLERQVVLFNASGTITSPRKWVPADE